MYTKGEIRKYISDKRDLTDISQRKIYDNKIFETLINSNFYKKTKVIFTFVSFKSEVDTHRIIDHAIRDGKTVCVPKIKSKIKGIDVFKIKGKKDLEKRYFGVMEPKDNCTPVNPKDIDLILMPGLAFDKRGGRIGYGGGFYDRFLKKLKKKVSKIALAYHFQILDEVPVNSLDVRVDGIITNKGIIFI